MAEQKARSLQSHTRALIQAAKFAIRDVYDAITELVTNSDDRYQFLNQDGVIEIEVERRRKTSQSVLRVRDFADGMDDSTMDKKLSWIGGRESGFDKGGEVRGTHSRGAKDIAALGHVTFESIAGDGRYHKCEITPFLKFLPPISSDVTPQIRESIGIPKGTGTLVTITLDNTQTVPQHDNLRNQICNLVSLRGILGDDRRTITLRDSGQQRKDVLKAPVTEGTDRLKETLTVPGYPQATAKLIIRRAKKRFDREPERFRHGGILVQSKHAIHEATLFDSGLESDPHALWFYGRLTSPYIDDLCNEFDEWFEKELPPQPHNPTYPLDPSRKSGLTREHPFVKSLFGEVLKKLRPLVEEERKREQNEVAQIENMTTRKRLNALERAALDFMHEFGEEDEAAREQDSTHPDSRLRERGYAIWPAYAQMIVGHSLLFYLIVRQETFPELEVGATVQIECLSPDVTTDKRFCGLEPHPTREGVLRAVWKVTAVSATEATEIRIRVGSIISESDIEVLACEADKYRNISELCFSNKRYGMRTDQKRKSIRIFAPLSHIPTATRIEVALDSAHFKLSGEPIMRPHREWGVSICELSLKCDGTEASGTLTAKHEGTQAMATIVSHKPLGAGLKIDIEDLDLGNQRYRWQQNVLQIAARHPSLQRYLGDKEHGFPGQDFKHFRILIAEVVADAVCARLVRRNVQTNPSLYEDADWDAYYAEFSKYMTQFLPIAHKIECPEG